jgi:hypothetical protein
VTFFLNTRELEDSFPTQDIAIIRQQFLRSAAHVNTCISLDNMNIYIKFFCGEPAYSYGVIACAPSSDCMKIYLHPESFYLRNNKNNGCIRYSAIIAHELHHNKRWCSRGYGDTLGEMIVSEGLALKFQRETGHQDFPEERYVHGESLHSMAERAKPLLNKIIPEYGKPTCSELLSINRYSLGLAIVEGWSEYTGITAAAAHDVRAENVLAPWLERKFRIASTPCAPR